MSKSVKSIFQKTTTLVAITSILTSVGATANAADLTLAPNPNAIPTGGQFISGTGSFSNPNATTLNMNQTSNYGHGQFTNLDVGVNGTFNINGPSRNATTVLSTTSNLPTTWAGHVNSDHNVALMNDKGLVMTSDFRGNLGSLIATTAKTVEQNGSTYKFSDINGTGSIVNNGQIKLSQGGYAVLVAPEVTNGNTGIINAHLGSVNLGSSNAFTIDVNGNGKINYLASPEMEKSIITNNGEITALGGRVQFNSEKARNLTDSVINLNGVINVDGMDSNLIGTNAPIIGKAEDTYNGSSIIATSYGDINSSNNLRAGHINLTSTNGDITTNGLMSYNTETINNAEAINLVAGADVNNLAPGKGKVTVNGTIIAINGFTKEHGGSDGGTPNAIVNILGAGDVTLKNDVSVGVLNPAGTNQIAGVESKVKGALARLDVKSINGDILTERPIHVGAEAIRLVNGTTEKGGDINAEAYATFKAKNVTHTGPVTIEAKAFHDARKYIEFLGKTAPQNSALGYYEIGPDGKPTTGKILLSHLGDYETAWADLTFVDFNNVGFFLIPDAGAVAGQNLTNKQDVTFKQVNGKWAVIDANNQVIKGADLGGSGTDYALFSDKALNFDGNKHLINSSSADGEFNWEYMTDALCKFNDLNFSVTDIGGPGKVKTIASYTADVGNQFYIPYTGADVKVLSSADAKNSEAEAYFVVNAGGPLALGDPRVTAKAYKNAYAKGAITSTASNTYINQPLIVESFAASRAVGSATSDALMIAAGTNYVGVPWGNGGAGGTINNGYLLSEATGGVRAEANTLVKGGIGNFIGNIAGAVANTYSGKDAVARNYINAPSYGYADISQFPDAYAFSSANGLVSAGRGTKFANDYTAEGVGNEANLFVSTGGSVTTKTNYYEGTGDIYTPYKNPVDCSTNDCSVANPNPNSKTIGYTTQFISGGQTAIIDDSGRTYAGKQADPIGFDPYKIVEVGYTLPSPTPTPNPEDSLNGRDFAVYTPPVITDAAPASGGGLFCRDVNIAGIPGLCSPEPIQEPAALVKPEPIKVSEAPAPAEELKPAPVYASPFKKGVSEGKKKASVANLEPASGNKCLSVNGKKVCIEDQIDK